MSYNAWVVLAARHAARAQGRGWSCAEKVLQWRGREGEREIRQTCEGSGCTFSRKSTVPPSICTCRDAARSLKQASARQTPAANGPHISIDTLMSTPWSSCWPYLASRVPARFVEGDLNPILDDTAGDLPLGNVTKPAVRVSAAECCTQAAAKRFTSGGKARGMHHKVER